MKYIESLREGERLNEIYLCKVKQSAMTKAGKPYDNLILQDKTGTLDAKIWDPGSVGIEEFDSLDYIAVMGDVTNFQGNLQLNVKRVRKVGVGEYDPKDYLPVSARDIEEMYQELLALIGSVKHPYLKRLLESFLWTMQILSNVSVFILRQSRCIMALLAGCWSIRSLLQRIVIIFARHILC